MTKKFFVTEMANLVYNIGREVTIEGNTIALFKLDDETVYAIGNRCPHSNGPLAEGTVAGEFVYCPLREFKVSLKTGELQAPDEGAVACYNTSLEGGNVYVWA